MPTKALDMVTQKGTQNPIEVGEEEAELDLKLKF